MKDRPERNPFAGKGWIIQGLVWGAFMFIIMGIVYPLVEKEALTAGSLARALVLWLVAGLVYGWAIAPTCAGTRSESASGRTEGGSWVTTTDFGAASGSKFPTTPAGSVP
ncbi:MAG: hypothetical protein LC114_26135 [Bryobacterales bacterium]|nr:hypothetical protein [Bryobacterales bacterium]